MIATVTYQGKTRWMIIDESFNSDRLIEFLEAMIKDAGTAVVGKKHLSGGEKISRM
jgi:hypothetical protein